MFYKKVVHEITECEQKINYSFYVKCLPRYCRIDSHPELHFRKSPLECRFCELYFGHPQQSTRPMRDFTLCTQFFYFSKSNTPCGLCCTIPEALHLMDRPSL